MLRSLFSLTACTAVVFGAGMALAADAEGNFAIKGAGLQNCGQFLSDWEAGNTNLPLYAGWLDGYVTAANQYERDLFDLTPWQTTDTLMRLAWRACSQVAPETRFMDITVRMLQEMAAMRLTSQSNLGGIRHGERALVIYDAVLESVEERLAAEGFAPASTGEFTQDTVEAIQSFQRARDLPVTGLPDQRTLIELLLSPANP